MQKVISTLTLASLLLAGPALAKNKILPGYIVQAHTVAVIIDPSAGIDIQDPRANQVAQKDVEAALLKWGRFELLVGAQKADLIVVIRRGHKRATDMTIRIRPRTIELERRRRITVWERERRTAGLRWWEGIPIDHNLKLHSLKGRLDPVMIRLPSTTVRRSVR